MAADGFDEWLHGFIEAIEGGRVCIAMIGGEGKGMPLRDGCAVHTGQAQLGSAAEFSASATATVSGMRES